jgi:two-component system, OmpR family, response regulator RegX3
VELDAAHHEVRVRGELVPMPPKEFALLEMLLRLKGRLLTRDHLIAEVWGSDYFGDTKTLDVHMKRLRQKVEEDPHRPAHLLTVRGLGYRFVD